MRYLLSSFLLILTFLAACGADSNEAVRERARAEAEQQARQPATASRPVANEPLPVLPTPVTSDKQLILSLGNGRGSQGDTVCLPVTVRDFTNLLGWQYTLRWDPAQLSFFRVQSFQLAQLTEANFGLTNTEKGFFINSWIDNNLRGVSIEDGRAIYEVCFALRGEPGARAEVTFSQDPAPFEVIDTNEDILRFNGQSGTITIE